MKAIFSFAFIFLLFGCVNTKPATSTEKDTAMYSYQGCVIDYVRKNDDGVSDAKSIAEATAYFCETKYKAALETYSRSLSKQAKRIFYQKNMSKDQMIKTPLIEVLRSRLNKKQNAGT